MKRYQTIQFSRGLPILILSSLGLMLMLSTLWFYQHQADQLERNIQVLLKERMGNMQHRIEGLLRLNQVELIAEQIADFSQSLDVTALALVDEHGKVLYANHRNWLGKAIAGLQPEFNPQYFADVQQDRRQRFYVIQHDQVFVYQPIGLASRPGEIRPNRIGVLLLEYSLTEAKTELRNELWLQAAINLFISAIVMLLLMVALERWLTSPLSFLRDSVRRISQGDFNTQIQIEGKGELVELAAAANKMQNDLADARTQMQKMIQLLRSHERELQKVTDALPGPVSRFDVQGNYVFASAAYQHWFGLSPDKLIGKSLLEISGAERYAIYEPHIRQALAGERVTFETRFTDPNGNVRDAMITMLPDLDVSDKVCGYFTICVDISERKRSEERFRSAVEAAPNAMIMVDAQGIIVLINTRTSDLFGYAENELIGQALNLLLPKQYHRTHTVLVKNFFEHTMSRRMGVGRELVGQHKDGHEIPLEIGLNPLTATDGVFVIASLIDITERKLVMERLHEKNAELERYTHMVSHDLKSPLVTIKTFLGYLKQDMAKADTARIESDMEFMSKAADKIEQLLEELLEMSRIGRVASLPEHISWRDAVQEALNINAGAIAQRGVVVTVEDADVLFLGQRSRLVQIWQNLIDNSVKFMGDQAAPNIRIGVELGENETVFYVCDNGIGIDSRYHDKIFGMFEKLNAKLPGTGLGLALVKRIVQLYRGKISVDSQGVGHGTCLRFTLPEALKKNQTRG